MDLSSLDRLVFGHLVIVEMLMKYSPASSPHLAVGQNREIEIHFNPEVKSGCHPQGLRYKKSDTYSSSSIGNRILSEKFKDLFSNRSVVRSNEPKIKYCWPRTLKYTISPIKKLNMKANQLSETYRMSYTICRKRAKAC